MLRVAPFYFDNMDLQTLINGESNLLFRTKLNGMLQALITGTEGANAIWAKIRTLVAEDETLQGSIDTLVIDLNNQLNDANDYTDTKVAALKTLINSIDGNFYGFYANSTSLPTGTVTGYAYVATATEGEYAIWNYVGSTLHWVDSGLTKITTTSDVPLVVSLTNTSGVYSADKTSAEIATAFGTKSLIVFKYVDGTTVTKWIVSTSESSAGKIVAYNNSSVLTYQSGTISFTNVSENVRFAKNNTGATVAKGKLVYISGSTGENPLFLLATNTDYTIAARTWGMTYESINNNAVGRIIHFGMIENLDTSAYTAGTELWLGVNGAFTNVRPTSPAFQTSIGMVIRQSATVGSIFVNMRYVNIESVRSQNPNTSPSSKLMDDELTNICGTDINISGFINTLGVHQNDSTRFHSDYLRISGNTNISILAESNNEYVDFISFYDVNKTYISGISNNQTTVSAQTILAENIPINTTYIRVSTVIGIKSFVKFDSIQSLIKDIEKNNISNKFDIENELYSKVDKVFGKNLFDKNSPDILQETYLSSGGGLNHNVNYLVSAYIMVKPNNTYTLNFNAGGGAHVIYNKYKEVISGTTSTTITIPENGYYIRLTAYTANIDLLQFEQGNISTYYEPFTDYNKVGLIAKQVPDRETTCILPKKMYFVKGKQSCIYYENVLLKNLNDPTTLYVNKGINYNRQVTFNFSTAVNSQLMNAQVVRSLRKGISKSITYDVIDPAANNGKTINVLHIGDSFTDLGTWVKETKKLLESQGVTYNLIGTCGNSTFRAEGLSGGRLDNTFLNSSGGFGRRVQITGVTVLPSTNYPGRTYRDSNGVDWSIRSGKIDGSGNGYMVVTRYGAAQADFANFPSSGILTKQDTGEGDATITYSNPTSCYFNPFINPSTGLLDISNYITTWGLANPDIVILQFLWNDLGEWSTDAQINLLVSNYKLAIDHIHSVYPNTKVIISVQPMGSINGNRDWNGKKYTVLRFSELMLTQFEDDTNYNTWVKIAPSYAFVDLVYGWSGGVNVSPCERYSSITEPSGGDGIHPATAGMQQIADCVSQVVSAII